MALCEIHLNQNNSALQKMTSFLAIVPEGKPGPFPVFYLLHGLSDDHTAWVRRSNIERYVDGLPLIVVMPNGERGFYTDSRANPKAAFETAIVRDIIGFVDANFQTIPTRAGRVIAGLSMGGYGALKLALKHPDKFCAAVSHSGAVEFGSRAFEGEDWRVTEYQPVFGPDPRGSSDDVYHLAETVDRALLPALRVDCGVDDFLIEDNRRLHRHLDQLGITHEYAENAGAHDWAYWNRHVLETIAFFCRALGLPEFKPDDHR